LRGSCVEVSRAESKISPCRAFLVAIDVAFDAKRR